MKRNHGYGKGVSTLPMAGGETRARSADRLQGAWINYQMKLNGVTQQQIAKMAGVSQQMVQRVAYGASTSSRVQKAIAMALGYKNWADMEAGRQGVAA